jgi:cytochrome c556
VFDLMPVGAIRGHAAGPGDWMTETIEGDHMIIRIAFAAAVVALGATAVIAQQDPIAARRAIMKANGQQAQLGTKMSKGEEPFTVEKGKKVFATYQDVAKAHELFPENSKTGGDTAALPAIWENKADFEARLTKLTNEAKAAEGKVTDLDSFKAQFTEVQKNCGGCHQTYRKRQS